MLGSEFVGIISAVGEGVENWRPGMRFVGRMIKLGAHAEFLVQKADGTMVEIPETINSVTTAALPFGALTALHFLENLARLSTGQRILIIGASEATEVVQLAKIPVRTLPPWRVESVVM